MKHKYESLTSNSNKTYTFTGEVILYWVHVVYTSRTMAGNRALRVEIKDSSGNVVYTVDAGLVQAANLTRDYHFSWGYPTNATFVGAGSDQNHQPLPHNLHVPSGGSIRIYDSAAVVADQNHDNMVVSFQYDGTLA